jgi:ferrochelatase
MSSKSIVFLNMGAPRSLKEVEVFLRNMFLDKNILLIKNTYIRKIVAEMIVFFRKKEALETYRKLGSISPLVMETEKFIKNARGYFSSYTVKQAMRYTPPFAQDTIKELFEKKVKEIFLFPMYPHFSYTTVFSSIEDFMDNLKKFDSYNPSVKKIDSFYANLDYNNIIKNSILSLLKDKRSKEFVLIFSAHSLPLKNIKSKNDSYPEEVRENVEIIKSLFKKDSVYFEKIFLAYQSKLGPIKWLEPSIGDILKELKHKKVIIYPISFLLDNSETVFELGVYYREFAKKAGIKDYILCGCVGNKIEFFRIVEDILNKKAQGVKYG